VIFGANPKSFSGAEVLTEKKFSAEKRDPDKFRFSTLRASTRVVSLTACSIHI